MQSAITPSSSQGEFIQSPYHSNLYVGGYGSGKSFALVLRMIMTKLQYPTVDLLYTAPTFSLVRDVLFPLIYEILEGTDIKYRINRSDNNIIFGAKGEGGMILCRSMDAPERLVGFTIGDVFCDELDTLTTDKARDIWNKCLGRMRKKFPPTAEYPKGKPNQIYVGTTPEGWKFCYEHFEKEPKNNKKKQQTRFLIRAKSSDNIHLPDGFVENMMESYPPELVRAYCNGEFCQLNSGAVYLHYDPSIHNTNVTIHSPDSDVLIVGADFNFQGSVNIIFVQIADCLFAVKELVSKDTFEMAEKLTKLSKETNKQLIIYPDASGLAQATNAKQSDIALLKQQGFRVKAPKKNPNVQDRVNSVNALFSHNRLFINQEQCPELHSAILQQIYSEGTGTPEKSHKPASIDDYNDSMGYPIHSIFPLKQNRMKYRTLGGL